MSTGTSWLLGLAIRISEIERLLLEQTYKVCDTTANSRAIGLNTIIDCIWRFRFFAGLGRANRLQGILCSLNCLYRGHY